MKAIAIGKTDKVKIHQITENENGLIELIIHFLDHHRDRIYSEDRKIKIFPGTRRGLNRSNEKTELTIWKTKNGQDSGRYEDKLLAKARVITSEPWEDKRYKYIEIYMNVKQGSKDEKIILDRYDKSFEDVILRMPEKPEYFLRTILLRLEK
jgi:hypothetical protein